MRHFTCEGFLKTLNFTTKEIWRLFTHLSIISIFLFSTIGFSQVIGNIDKLEQAANGKIDSPESPTKWVTGIVNAAKAHYTEDMSIVYRLSISGLDPNETYSVTIGYDTQKDFKHTLDFLTSYDYIGTHPTFNHGPLEVSDILLDSGIEGAIEIRYPIIAPGSLGSLKLGEPTNSFNSLPPGDRELSIFNGTMVGAMSYTRQDNLTLGTTSTFLKINFKAKPGQSKVIFAWGGHIASAFLWDQGFSASSVNGAPYHMFVAACEKLNGCGNKEVQLQASAVFPPPSCSLSGPTTACAGDSNKFYTATVINPDSPTYFWTLTPSSGSDAEIAGGEGTATLEVNPGTNGGSYEVKLVVTNANTLSSPPCTINTVVGEVIAEAGGPHAVCYDDGDNTIQLNGSASGGTVALDYKYTWSGTGSNYLSATNVADPTFDDAEVGPYTLTLTVEDDNGCKDTDTVSLEIYANPTLQGGEICLDVSGSAGTLQLSGSGTAALIGPYVSSDTGVATVADDGLVTAVSAGSTTITYTDDNGCTVDATVTIYDNPDAGFTISNVCENELGDDLSPTDTSQANESGTLTYAWSVTDDNAGDNEVATDATSAPSFDLPPGDYTITLTVTESGTNCTDTFSDQVTINPNPVADITTSGVCDGENSIFTATPAGLANYEFFVDANTNGVIDTGESKQSGTSDTYNAGSLSNGDVISVEVTDSNGCTDVDTAAAIVYDNPTLQGGEICLDVSGSAGTLQLSGSGTPANNTPYVSSDTGVATVADDGLVTAVSAGSTTITYTDDNGCTVDATVTIYDNPDAGFTISNVCENELGDDLSPTDTSQANESGTLTYAWSVTDDNAGDNEVATDATSAPSFDLPPGDYTITLTVTESGTNCTDTFSDQVTINPNPVADITTSGVCDGENSIFTATPAGLANYEFFVDANTNGVIDTGESKQSGTSDTYNAGSLSNGDVISVEVTDSNGCTDVDTAAAIVYDNPTLQGGEICLDVSGSAGTLQLSGSGTPANNTPYVSSDTGVATVADDGLVTAVSAGSTTITYTDENGCTVDATVIVNPNPPLAIQIVPNDCFSDPLNPGKFTVTSDRAGLLFKLDNGNFEEYPEEGEYTGLAAGDHTITAKVIATGCETQLPFTIAQPFSTPIDPELSSTPPDCTTFQGTIFVDNHIFDDPNDPDFEENTYSVKLKSDQSNPVFVAYPANGFENLDPGVYVVIAKSADGCSSGGAEITLDEPNCAHIFPTQTDCDEYKCISQSANQTDFTLSNICLTIRGQKVRNATPGVFFYYADVTGKAVSTTVVVDQTTGLSQHFIAQNEQNVRVYSNQCGVLVPTSITINDNNDGEDKGDVIISFDSSEGVNYIISVKYDVKTIIGADKPDSDAKAKFEMFYDDYADNGGIVVGGSAGEISLNSGNNCDPNPIQDPDTCTSSSSVTSTSKAQEEPLSISTDDNTLSSVVVNSFKSYPVPFKETLNVQYDFDYESAAVIQLFDLQGRLLRTYNEAKAYKGKVTELGIDFRTRASQVYIVKITTDRDVFTKKIISDK